MDAIEITVSPRIVCQCGKSILRMNAEQQALYNETISKIHETRSTHDDKAESRICEPRYEKQDGKILLHS